ncbi:hypothetical protein C9374_004706 [Naegleria lovaniensis]|uniref:Uncharacterized protein n=1 Tax=Naegleria lovaniensis TaxID=51637 RepID=A0AA88GLW3_NAELO|nr:uncharacterized protein C9374_004706 [Naegleria lovaniensis]KAG2383369.1 hypothetical protein C9374_004706 [Naegleria lovaniensis]
MKRMSSEREDSHLSDSSEKPFEGAKTTTEHHHTDSEMTSNKKTKMNDHSSSFFQSELEKNLVKIQLVDLGHEVVSSELFTKFKNHMRDPVIARFKLLLLGSRLVGKTTFINCFNIDPNSVQQLPEINTTIYPITFATPKGKICFQVWDYQNDNRHFDDDGESIPKEFYQNAHCAILMFDTTLRMSYKVIPQYYRKVQAFSNQQQTIPIVLCGNKVDFIDRKVKRRHIWFHRKKNIAYYDVSAKGNYCIQNPFLSLARQLLKDRDFTFDSSAFISCTNLKPPNVIIDSTRIEIMEKDHMYYDGFPLPDDDDEL